jgi:hypothetical protein
VPLPDAQPPTDAKQAAALLAEVVARVCRGECDPKYLTTLSYGVNSFLKAINLSDVQQRLEKVEQAIKRKEA